MEDKRADLGALPEHPDLGTEDVAAIREIGDNTGSMRLKGASADQDEVAPDRWPLVEDLVAAGRRYGIDAERDLATLAG